ncbi:hypothetical protein PUW24_09590 [Paenibacillus urinalis]|uniref:Uncharacterized protein n=1 Tax=Paenibacillus urinalis TaxID=521520 RepID=A0AAX3MZM1_9BACL|nr:hypothetical protein [Paenibacillus urinalis]WDH83045.1 hypothetical protein PUW23_02030 [Paenibacillus urinalis]WDH99100.1 hypothetical protein PUW24_09590 [Paenibacillus urinalis]WDI02790.1 hypothetical protein PUW25_02035 [Paenibacillus urinalis]
MIAIAAFMIVLLLWLYIYHASSLRQGKYRRMDDLQDTLYTYSKLAGHLTLGLKKDGLPGEPLHGALILALQESKSAPCLTPHLREQIQACLAEGDEAGLQLLSRSLEREMTRLAAERDRLFSSVHSPRWGQALWQIIQPMFAPLAAVGIAVLLYQFMTGARDITEGSTAWEWVLLSARLVSGMISIAYVYILILMRPRTAAGLITNLLSLAIILAALFHLIGLAAAPYVLGGQLILFLLGFKWSKPPSRKERPYAGQFAAMDKQESQLYR